MKNSNDKPKRWNIQDMLDVGRRLFAKINKTKRFANPNHEVHVMAREIDTWLPPGCDNVYISSS